MYPAIFIGHGNPMHAIEENGFTQTWRSLGETLPRPRAIVSISAHWQSVGTFVTASESLRTIHDFYGFSQALFDVQYPASGTPKLAAKIIDRLGEVRIHADYDWGLDHGSWSVLRHIFPAADVPVIQLSLDQTKSAKWHYEFAKELQFLRGEEVLVLGSGNIVHNLRRMNPVNRDGDPWAISANQDIKECVLTNDHQTLIDYQNMGSDVAMAVPTPEHFLPLLYVLGLKKSVENIEVFRVSSESINHYH